jgi:hypothetical protein
VSMTTIVPTNMRMKRMDSMVDRLKVIALWSVVAGRFAGLYPDFTTQAILPGFT